MTDIQDLITAVQTMSNKTGGQEFSFFVNIPDYGLSMDRVAVLSIHAMTTSTNTGDFEITAAIRSDLSFTEAVKGTHTTNNRRHRGGIFYLSMPPTGDQTITIKTTRPVNSIVAIFGLASGLDVSHPFVAGASEVGNAAGLGLDFTPAGGPVFVAGQTRRGDQLISPANESQLILAQVTTDLNDSGAEVSGALFAIPDPTPGESLTVGMTAAGSTVLLVAEFSRSTIPDPDPDPDPEPAKRLYELFVIVRDIPPGGSVEVRHVKPGDMVNKVDGYGIDWEKTRFSGFIVTEPAEDPDPEDGE